MRRILAVILGFGLVVVQAHAQQLQRAKTSSYQIPSDVVSSGGGDKAHSTNYLLDDTIGEANIGFGRSSNYDMNAGYRQPDGGTFLSLTCEDLTNLGTITMNGQATADNTCTVITDNDAGYALSWSVRTGSGGTNTGHLISTTAPHTNTIPPFDAAMTDLAGYWKMDETTAGSTVQDASGNGNNGSLVGTTGPNNLPQPSTSIPTTVNVADVRSLDFDATDDLVSYGSPATLDDLDTGGGGMTLSAWIYPRTLGLSSAGVIFGKGTSGVGAGEGDWLFRMGTTSRFFFEKGFGTTTLSVAAVNGSITLNTWQHVAVTWDGTSSASNVHLYLNGVETSYQLQQSGVGAKGSDAALNMYTGGAGPTGRYFDGRLDELRAYRRVLSAAEVQALASIPHTWSVAVNQSSWGGRLRSSSTDIDSKWGTDSSSEKWLNIGNGTYPLVSRTSRTSVTGSTQILQFRAGVGATAIVPTGVYETTVTLTASAL